MEHNNFYEDDSIDEYVVEEDDEEEINQQALFDMRFYAQPVNRQRRFVVTQSELQRRSYDIEIKMFELDSREEVLSKMQEELEEREDELHESQKQLRSDKRKVTKNMLHTNCLQKRAEDTELLIRVTQREVDERLADLTQQAQKVLHTTIDEEAGENEASCTVCFINKLCIAPGCGHLCMCRACAAHIHFKGGRKCPMCRESWNTLTKIIIS
jgi:site-specific DNA-cytosine methylase